MFDSASAEQHVVEAGGVAGDPKVGPEISFGAKNSDQLFEFAREKENDPEVKIEEKGNIEFFGLTGDEGPPLKQVMKLPFFGKSFFSLITNKLTY